MLLASCDLHIDLPTETLAILWQLKHHAALQYNLD